jgi:hypothetical protein
MVALHNTGNVNAGTMTNPSASSTVTNAANGRTYHEHNPAQGFGGGSTVSWTVDWTAPMTGPDGDITFYAASVLANGNGNNGGDGVVTTNESGLFMGVTPLTVAITASTNVTCNGGNDGSATALGAGGIIPYSYLWSNGEANATAVLLEAGMQDVTVTDAGGQTATASITITEPDVLSVNETVLNHITCNGDNDGTASVNPSGGTSPYSYLWSNGQTTMMASGLMPGSQFITVTDASSCESIGEVIITEPDILTLDLVIQTNISCFGFNDGAATVAAMGGTNPYTYTWSNGQAGPSANNLVPGLQTVTVTDANSCSENLQIIITEPSELMLNLVTQENVSCFNGNDGSATVSAVGGTGSYNFQWSNGQTGATANNLTAASYTCMVTDVNGCLDMLSVNITQPLEMNIDLMITHETAPGANDGSITANATGGVAPYTYEWSNGSSGPVIMNLMPGTYTVEVTDANGCIKVSSGTVNGSGCTLTTSIVVLADLTCPNDSIAMLTYEANEDIATIEWSTGAVTDTIGGLPSGSYMITVTGTDGCMAEASVTLNATDTESPTYINDTLCLFVDNDGMAILDSATFYDNLSDNCDDDPTAIFNEIMVNCDDLGMSSVDIVLRDASGNINTATLFLRTVDTIAPLISCPIDITVNTCDTINYPMPLATDNCSEVMVELIAGIGPGQIFPVGTTTEVYRAIDPTGNQMTCSFQVTVVSDLAVDVTTSDASCSDATDGAAVVAITGGTAPYSFVINPTGDVTMLAAGIYQVIAQDDANCAVVDTFEVQAPDPLTIDSVVVMDATAGNFDGSIDIHVSGGTPPYAFTWLRDTTLYSVDEDLTNLFAGYYSVSLLDANGCDYSLDSIFVDGMVATNNLQDIRKNIKIFEYDHTFYVQPLHDIGVYDIILFDGQGRFMFKSEHHMGNASIDISHLATGFYILQVKTYQDGVISKSLIVP